RGNGATSSVGRWRFADDVVEGTAERAQTGEPDIQADVGHAALRRAEQEHRPLDPTALEIAVRCLAERGTKGPDEMGFGHVDQARERRDVQWLREGAVHRVPGSK